MSKIIIQNKANTMNSKPFPCELLQFFQVAIYMGLNTCLGLIQYLQLENFQCCFGNENNFSISISFSRKCNFVLVLVSVMVDSDDFFSFSYSFSYSNVNHFLF